METTATRGKAALQWADTRPWHWPEKLALLALVVVLAAIGVPIDDWVGQDGTWLNGFASFCTAVPILLWRERPGWTVLLTCSLISLFAALGVEPIFLGTPMFTAVAFIAGERFGGRNAWIVLVAGVIWGQSVYWTTGTENPAFAIFTVPGYVAGVILRLRRQTAEQLAIRTAELEAERELFAELSVRNERSRIAAELHDVIGHALSVVVVQSAAGQRLIGRDDEAVDAALTAIADSTRQGREDLRRLLDLLEGEDVTAPDLGLVDELVARAAASGLAVTCLFEGDRDGIAAPVASVAFRVVQESLTNALRYAPGSPVRVVLRGEGRRLSVTVENDAPTGTMTGLQGGGTGLAGLRDLVREVGGSLTYGLRPGGGWSVEAQLGR